MSSSAKDGFPLDPKTRETARRLAQVGPQVNLSPATIGTLNKLAALSPGVDMYRQTIAKDMASTIAAFNQASNYRMNTLGPELARTASTIAGLQSMTAQFATSPGFRALAEGVRSYQRFDSTLTAQMKGIADTILKAADVTAAWRSSNVLNVLAAANAQMAQNTEVIASIRPLMDQLNTNIAASYQIRDVLSANASAVVSASQMFTGISESLKLKQSLMTSEMAKAIYASSAALRDIDALTLSRINLATGYAERVAAMLDEDEALSTVASEVEKRFIDRFRMVERQHRTLSTFSSGWPSSRRSSTGWRMDPPQCQ